MDGNSNIQKLLSIGPVDAKKRIELTKVLNEWAKCTDVLFEGENEKYNLLQAYKPSEESLDQAVFIRRGDNRLYILDEIIYPSEIEERDASQILLGMNIWRTWHSSLEQYLIETVRMSKQIECEQATDWYKQGMCKIIDGYESNLAEIANLQASADKRYLDKRRELTDHIETLTHVKTKELKDEIANCDRLIKEHTTKQINELFVNAHIIDIRSHHDGLLLKEIDSMIEIQGKKLNNNLSELENKFQQTCIDIKKEYAEIQSRYKELPPQTIIDAKTDMKDKLLAANRKLKQENKQERERHTQFVKNKKAELRLKHRYNADIEIAHAKKAVKNIKESKIHSDSKAKFQSQLDDVKKEIRDTRKQISELVREIHPVKKSFSMEKQELKTELKRKLSDIQHKYKSGFKISIRRVAHVTDLQEYI